MATQRFKRDDYTPEFDLDEYIDEKSGEIPRDEYIEDQINYPKPTARRNIVVILAFFVLTGIWAMTGGPLSIFTFEEGSNGFDVNVGNPINAPIEAPVAPLPPPPQIAEINTGYLDYLAEINQAFPNQFSGSAIQRCV